MTQLTTHVALSAQLIELSGNVPTTIRLLPAGRFRAKDGRPSTLPDGWHLDDANAARVIAAAKAQQDQILIDYEHQTLYSKENGAKAPAAGWFSALEWRPGDGLYATDVEWTAAAQAAIQAKEYRYISPVLTFDPRTGDVTGILMAALVNFPALDGLADLAAARFSPITEQESMYEDLIEDLREVLNLPTAATPAELAAELDKVKALLVPDASVGLAAHITNIHAKLADQEEAVAALTAQVSAPPDPALFAPVATVTELQNQVAALSAQVQTDALAKLIEPALADGRLVPSLKGWAESLGQKDMDALSTYLAAAQPIAALSGTQTGGIPPATTPTSSKAAVKAPEGYQVDDDRAALHAEILAYADAHQLSYAAAATAIGA